MGCEPGCRAKLEWMRASQRTLWFLLCLFLATLSACESSTEVGAFSIQQVSTTEYDPTHSPLAGSASNQSEHHTFSPLANAPTLAPTLPTDTELRGFDPGIEPYLEHIKRFVDPRYQAVAASIVQVESCGLVSADSGSSFGPWQIYRGWMSRESLANLSLQLRGNTRSSLPPESELAGLTNEAQVLEAWFSDPERNTLLGLDILQLAINTHPGNFSAILAEYNGGPFAGQWIAEYMNTAGIRADSADWLTSELDEDLLFAALRSQYSDALIELGFSPQTAQNKSDEVIQYLKLTLPMLAPATREDAVADWLDAGGRSLCAEAWLSGQDPDRLHRVQSGETLSSIAAAYGTTVDALHVLNVDVPYYVDQNTLFVGQPLVVSER